MSDEKFVFESLDKEALDEFTKIMDEIEIEDRTKRFRIKASEILNLYYYVKQQEAKNYTLTLTDIGNDVSIEIEIEDRPETRENVTEYDVD